MSKNASQGKATSANDPLKVVGAVLGAVGTILGIASLVIGILQFRTMQDRQEQSQAVDLLIKYNDLMLQSDSDLGFEQQQWKHNLAVAIAEAIFLLRTDDPGWVKTVQSMLSDHLSFFDEPKPGEEVWVECDTYTASFQRLINETTKRTVCK